MRQFIISSPRSGTREALLLFLLVTAFGWLTMSGHTYARDEETVFATAQSLFDRHQFALPEGMPVVEARPGVNGVGYGPYGPLQSVLLAPLYGFSKLLWGNASEPYTGYLSRLVASMLTPAVHAATLALLFLTALRLRYSRRGALVMALVYGFATWAWPHSRTLFTEPLTSLLLVASFYVLLRARTASKRAQMGMFAASGFALALSIAARAPTAIVVPVYGLYVLWLASHYPPHLFTLWLSRFTFHVSRLVLLWPLGFAIGIVPLMALNTDIFGGPFATGYSEQARTFLFATPLQEGLYGLLLSPGKGAFWYAPALLLSGIAWPIFQRRARAEAVFCAGVIAVIVLFHATVLYWAGGGAWGPRYISIALPFAVLPLAGLWGYPGWIAMSRGRTSRLARSAVAWGLVTVGLFVNLYGAAVNFNTWVVTADESKRNFEPYYSALAAHPRILAERIVEWWPGLNAPAGVLLRDGFSYSEGKDGAALPRWTLADARFSLNAGAPTPLTIRYADHRPPPLPRAVVSMWVDGKRLDAAPAPAGGVESQFTLTVPAGALLEMRSDTWNPSALGQSDRDENLGVQLVSITRADGAPLMVTALPQIPAMPNSGFGRWAWFYRPDYHHAVDLWAWYLAASGAPPGIAMRAALVVLIPSALLIGLAGWLAYAMRPARRTVLARRNEANAAGRA